MGGILGLDGATYFFAMLMVDSDPAQHAGPCAIRDRLHPDKRLYSFDLFDTLVGRILKRPFQVFDLLEYSGAISYRLPGIGIFGFRRWRILAERIARRLSAREDVSLVEVYRILGWLIARPARVMRQELALETAVISPIAENVRLLQHLLQQGKSCCIVTDMYLPASVLRRIVRRTLGRSLDIFPSSQFGRTKATGELFRLVAEHYGLPLSEIQHVGDNPHSDVDVPRRLGMSATRVPPRCVRDSAKTIFEYFAPRELDDSVFAEIGYSLVGPICAAFAQFIREGVERRGIGKVFFCARDGYLIKEAYDRLGAQAASHYLRLSRRALYLPLLAYHSDYTYLFEGRISAEEFFARLDLSVPDQLRGLDPAQHRDRFVAALKESRLQDKARTEADALMAYLDEQQFHGDVAFVDLGWRGSLQNSLMTMTGDRCNIDGFYFGSIVNAPRTHCYYFNNCLPLDRLARVFQALPVFEYLFTEPVWSVKCISRQDGEFHFEYLKDEPPEQVAIREEIAKGCRAFLDDFHRVSDLLGLSSQEFLPSLDVLIRRRLDIPDDALIDAFRRIGHAEGFGGSKFARIVGSENFSLSGYRDSYWRAAYVAKAAGISGHIGRIVHAFTYSRLGMFLIYRRGIVGSIAKFLMASVLSKRDFQG